MKPKYLAAMPDWFYPLASALIDQADDVFEEGATAEKWVVAALKAAATLHDIPLVPEKLEREIEDKVITFAVRTLFKIKFTVDRDAQFRRKMKKAERKVAKGDWEPTYWNPELKAYLTSGEDPGWNQNDHDVYWEQFRAY